MKRAIQLAAILLVGILLMADAWVITRYVTGDRVRAVVVDSKPGEASVRFERLPLERADYIVLAIVALAHVGGIAVVCRAWTEVRRTKLKASSG